MTLTSLTTEKYDLSENICVNAENSLLRKLLVDYRSMEKIGTITTFAMTGCGGRVCLMRF